MNHRLTYIILMLAGILAGCTGARELTPSSTDEPVPLPERTPAELLAPLYALNPPATFTIAAQIRWHEPSRQVTFNGNLYVARDSLFATFSPGLGIQVARLLVTRDSLFFFNRLENTLYYTALSDLSDAIAYPLSLESVTRLLTGTIQPPASTYREALPLQDTYLLEATDGSASLEIQPAPLRIRQLTLYKAAQPVLHSQFTDWRYLHDQVIPYTIRLTLPQSGQTLTFRYRSFKVRPPSYPLKGLGLRPHTRRQPLALLQASEQ